VFASESDVHILFHTRFRAHENLTTKAEVWRRRTLPPPVTVNRRAAAVPTTNTQRAADGKIASAFALVYNMAACTL